MVNLIRLKTILIIEMTLMISVLFHLLYVISH